MGKHGPKSKHGLEWGSPTAKGYIRGYDANSGRQRFAHNIEWERVNGPIPEGYQVHHINGCKTDNRIKNLDVEIEKDINKYSSFLELSRECSKYDLVGPASGEGVHFRYNPKTLPGVKIYRRMVHIKTS
jgi:hypothetical protein